MWLPGAWYERANRAPAVLNSRSDRLARESRACEGSGGTGGVGGRRVTWPASEASHPAGRPPITRDGPAMPQPASAGHRIGLIRGNGVGKSTPDYESWGCLSAAALSKHDPVRPQLPQSGPCSRKRSAPAPWPDRATARAEVFAFRASATAAACASTEPSAASHQPIPDSDTSTPSRQGSRRELAGTADEGRAGARPFPRIRS